MRVVIVTCWHPPFLRGVTHIVSVRAGEEMVTANTAAIIAFMADKEFARDGAILKFVANAMGVGATTVNVHDAIAIDGDATEPCPATIRRRGVIHFGPEAFVYGPDSVGLTPRLIVGMDETVARLDFRTATAFTETGRERRDILRAHGRPPIGDAKPQAVTSGAEAFPCLQYTTMGEDDP